MSLSGGFLHQNDVYGRAEKDLTDGVNINNELKTRARLAKKSRKLHACLCCISAVFMP